MADINNYMEISENFDTIKTLLNSIRAQGILNTSDVDKILVGINSKLEKINTEEDIDLIKIFLGDLKKNLEERHSVLISKFGAIEALFSNLLKNSADMLKTSEVKELFDIVATNLSVFSREVVAQKETLSDITLRLDAIRSDDSQKKEVIKNISFLKTDIERLTNGFDSIVLSLNENFKTVIKTISSIDPTQNIEKFGKQIENILDSSNTILSVLQVLDKKHMQFENSLQGIATQSDIELAQNQISELVIQDKKLTDSVDNLANKYYKIDNLADKIDASVDIIASIKNSIQEQDKANSNVLLDKLVELENSLLKISSNNEFEDFKTSLESLLSNILNDSNLIQDLVTDNRSNLKQIESAISALDLNLATSNVISSVSSAEQNVNTEIGKQSEKIIKLIDSNSTRTLNEISSNAETLDKSISQAQTLMTALCERSFSDVVENISALKSVISQIDENNVSANNAIFANITDRLAIFENSLKTSLVKQEDYVSNSATELITQVNSIKEISGVLDYKLDASSIEINNAKNEFSGLKDSVNAVLALDFVNKIKDLKADLYASKQDLADSIENSFTDLSDKMANDLFGKYELLTGKLDSVESDLSNAQSDILNGIKLNIENIASSIVDILSYVSAKANETCENDGLKYDDIVKVINDNNLNFVENLRDVVDDIKEEIDSNIKNLKNERQNQFEDLKESFNISVDDIKQEIKNSYDKLLEFQDNIDSLKSTVDVKGDSLHENLSEVCNAANTLKLDFETKLFTLKNSILDKVDEFQKNLICENADKLSELKFANENLYSKNSLDIQSIKEDVATNIVEATSKVSETILQDLTDANNELRNDICEHNNQIESSLSQKMEVVRLDVKDEVNVACENNSDIIIQNLEALKAVLKQDIKAAISNSDNLTTKLLSELEEFLKSDVIASSENSSVAIIQVLNEVKSSLNNEISDALNNSEDYVSKIVSELEENLRHSFNATSDNSKEALLQVIQDTQDKIREEILSANEQYVNFVTQMAENVRNQYRTEVIDVLRDSEQNINSNILTSSDDIRNNVIATIHSNSEILSQNIENIKNSVSESIFSIVSLIEDKNANLFENLDNIVSDLKSTNTETAEDNINEIKLSKIELKNDINELSHNIENCVTNNSNNIISSLNQNFSDIKNDNVYNSNKVIDSNNEIAQRTLDSVKENIDSACENLSINLKSNSDDILNALLDNANSSKDENDRLLEKFIESTNSVSEKINNNSDENREIINTNLKSNSDEILNALINNSQESKATSNFLAEKVISLNKDSISVAKNDISKLLDDNVQNLNSNLDSVSDKIITNINLSTSDVKDSIQRTSENFVSLEDNLNSLQNEIITNSSLSKEELSSLINKTSDDIVLNINRSTDTIKDIITTKDEKFNKLDEELNIIQDNMQSHKSLIVDSISASSEKSVNDIIDALIKNVDALKSDIIDNSSKVIESNSNVSSFIKDGVFSELKNNTSNIEKCLSDIAYSLESRADDVTMKCNDVEDALLEFTEKNINSNDSALESILENFEELKGQIDNLSLSSAKSLKDLFENIASDFSSIKTAVQKIDTNVDEDLTRQLSLIEDSFAVLTNRLDEKLQEREDLFAKTIDNGINNISTSLNDAVVENLQEYKNQIEILFQELSTKNSSQSNFITDKVLELNDIINKAIDEQSTYTEQRLSQISANLKQILEENLEMTVVDYNSLKSNILSFAQELEDKNSLFADEIKTQFDSIARFVDTGLEQQAQEIQEKIVNITNSVNEIVNSTSGLNDNVNDRVSEVKSDIDSLSHTIQSLFEENSLNILTQFGNCDSKIIEEIQANSSFLKDSFVQLNERLDKDDLSNIDLFQAQLSDLTDHFNNLMLESKQATKEEVASIVQTLIHTNNSVIDDLETSLGVKIDSILSTSNENMATNVQTLSDSVVRVVDQIKNNENTLNSCKDFLASLVKNEIQFVNGNINSVTEQVTNSILEKVEQLKVEHKEDFSKQTISIEKSVEEYITNELNSLKSYFDLRTDTTIIDEKITGVVTQLNSSVEGILNATSNLVSSNVFDDAVADIKQASNILISSMSESLNTQLKEFITNNISNKILDKFNLFDKKFTDTIVDKYEEAKVISIKNNESIQNVDSSIRLLLSQFDNSKKDINNTFSDLLDNLNGKIDKLEVSLAELKANIFSKFSITEDQKSYDSATISDIENLIKQQFSYLEDIGELCGNNLPELTEMNAIVKYNLTESISALNSKIESNDTNLKNGLNDLKTEVITQFLNIFNQISFVAEQQEIIDFIQEKHTDLISILSHVVTSVEEVTNVKDNVAVLDTKIDSLKEDIDLINEKITSIISSDGDIDYVYSLQDLESDIANLRICLNEAHVKNNSKEFEDLVNSTNAIYSLVESIKKEISLFKTEGLKQGLGSLNDDIVSISTRTNKLILASDESNKALQENLQDFKLVINDLDERTRNFAHESGLDLIDSKLGTLNNMIQNGAKTNQVFNQVFEYLAEWVDNAGAQITEISDKVNSLDDITQIKIMLEDLRAESEESNSEELVEALSNVFANQAKKISSLEAKLDRVIVDSTINSKIDVSPLEDTLNKFLVVMGDKIQNQQEKIDLLESKLEDVASLINPKDTAQLTKKVGGMDRQIAKMNKNIEKIASHVVNK